jgi:hypothetical protein
MIEKLLKIFKRPFPLIETNKEKFFLSVAIGVFIFCFLSVFQPFELNRLNEHKYLFFMGYGLVSFSVELFFTFGLMNIFHQFYNPLKWTLGKHLINVLFFIASLAFFNWLFTVWIYYPNYNAFTPFLIDTLSLGFFPVIFIFFYLERKLRIKNIILSEKFNIMIEKKSNLSKIRKENNNSIIRVDNKAIDIKNLLYVKSLGNYVSICFTENGKNKKEVVRTTMKKIENSLGENTSIVRCHKSYFINLKRVTNSLGNARSLYFQIDGAEAQIPVSRKVAKELTAKIS